MATAQNIGIIGATFKADEALDDRLYYACTTASTVGYVKTANGASAPMPLGIIQDNSASAVSDAVAVGLFGPMKAKVAACDLNDNACPISQGDYLTVNASGYLCRAGSDAAYNAYALGAISTSCRLATIEVFWFGPISACAYEAS